MSSQRILIVAVGGILAETVQQHIRRCSELRTTTSKVRWTPEDWPLSTRHEIDAFVTSIATAGFTPPILYRSEHVDSWSTGDVFSGVCHKLDTNFHQLHTSKHEVYAACVSTRMRIISNKEASQETIWFHDRINEAIAAWSGLVEQRLVVIVRSVLGGLWMDEEVTEALSTIPDWWKTRE